MRPSSAPCTARACSSTLGGRSDDGNVMQLRADLGARRGLGNDNLVDEARGLRRRLGIQYSWAAPARRVVDTDGDGVTDDLDKCPGTPAGTAVDATGCPLPQDDDGDGVTNDIDKCPGTPAGVKVDASGCELDSDGDGVVDSRDQCPEHAGRREGRRQGLRARQRRRRRDRQRGQVPRHAEGRSRGCRRLLVQGRDQTTRRGVRNGQARTSSPRACRCSKAPSRRSSVIPT